MNKPHKHAALMAEYAKDAAETETPWKRWQYKQNHRWIDFETAFIFYVESEYRRKPRTININGHEVPEPMRVRPNEGDDYYPVDLSEKSLCRYYKWRDDGIDHDAFSKGLCHSTSEAAIAHAKALLSFTSQPQ